MRALYLAGAIAMCGAGAAQAVSIVNGGFEDPGTFSGGFQNTSSLSGWTVAGNVDLINTYWQPSEGSYSLDLNGSRSSASISQILTGLTAGATYRILFDMSGNPAGPPPTKMVTVGTDEGSATYSYDTAVSGNSLSNMKWQTITHLFTAASTSTTLTFASAQAATSYGPALDNIQIAPAAAPVPLPAGCILLVSAFGLLALRRRGS